MATTVPHFLTGNFISANNYRNKVGLNLRFGASKLWWQGILHAAEIHCLHSPVRSLLYQLSASGRQLHHQGKKYQPQEHSMSHSRQSLCSARGVFLYQVATSHCEKRMEVPPDCFFCFEFVLTGLQAGGRRESSCSWTGCLWFALLLQRSYLCTQGLHCPYCVYKLISLESILSSIFLQI